MAKQTFRTESDLLGEKQVPADAYYGIQTLRAMENFNISGVPLCHFPNLVKALALVKKACAAANRDLGQLDKDIAKYIIAACDEIIDGQLHEQFRVDMIQGGAGTSTNMNANEVIANRALELMGKKKGQYEILHPNIHVNMAQSTNDVYPTSVRLAMVLRHKELIHACKRLQASFEAKSIAFKDVMKMGRTQLQDAVPMTLGQEFRAFATTIGEDIDRLGEMAALLLEVNLGGTAIGTGLNSEHGYAELACKYLAEYSGEDIKLAGDLVEATSDMGAFVIFSSMLKRVAVKMSKICNDLRLLSSGPKCGLNEINLPEMQPGSSIMPGKVNPVIPEALNQVAFAVIGNDVTVTFAAEAGQLQLNVMEPVIVYKILESVSFLSSAIDGMRENCVDGITANVEVCRNNIDNSIGIVTALNPYIGYKKTSHVARRALLENKRVKDIVLDEGWMTEAEVDEALAPEKMLAPNPPVGQEPGYGRILKGEIDDPTQTDD